MKSSFQSPPAEMEYAGKVCAVTGADIVVDGGYTRNLTSLTPRTAR